METLLACWPERQRSALWLAAVEGYSYEEIAEILETPIRSVKSLVHGARAGLAEPAGETARIERNIDRWREMSESERESDREQMKRFRAMSVEDRRMLLDAWVGPEPRRVILRFRCGRRVEQAVRANTVERAWRSCHPPGADPVSK